MPPHYSRRMHLPVRCTARRRAGCRLNPCSMMDIEEEGWIGGATQLVSRKYPANSKEA
jgi:hypothetical protein